MTRLTMTVQIVSLTVAGMVVRKELPNTQEEFLNRLKKSCNSIMENPPTDEEINEALSTGMPLNFAEKLADLYKGYKGEEK